MCQWKDKQRTKKDNEQLEKDRIRTKVEISGYFCSGDVEVDGLESIRRMYEVDVSPFRAGVGVCHHPQIYRRKILSL